MLTSDMMHRLWQSGDPKVSQLIDGIVAAAPTIFPKYGLSSDLVIAHAMAQFSHECGAGTEMVENIRYSARRAAEVWPSRFRDEADVYAKVGSFAGDPGFPVKLIDNVYGNRMGNRPGTHDGSTFIGRGLSQVTGREGYQKLGARVGRDLLGHPELALDPTHALECGVADFVLCGCLPFAEVDDVSGVTQHLNGGFNGLSERIAWLQRWKTALGSENPAPHGTVWVQASLNRLGAEPTLVTDGSFGPLTAAAVRSFQARQGLEADGKAGPGTFAAIEAALAAL